MAKENKTTDRSLLRLLLWEGLALAGFLHLLEHPLANEFWGWLFHYNALIFLLAYPILYVYRWKMVGGCLGMVLWPLSFVLDWLLAASFYLWLAYLFLILGLPFYSALRHHWIVLGVLSLFIYFPWVQPLWGIDRKYYRIGDLLRLTVGCGLGGAAGFLAGWALVQGLGAHLSGEHRFTLWLTLALMGTAVAGFIAKKGLDK